MSSRTEDAHLPVKLEESANTAGAGEVGETAQSNHHAQPDINALDMSSRAEVKPDLNEPIKVEEIAETAQRADNEQRDVDAVS